MPSTPDTANTSTLSSSMKGVFDVLKEKKATIGPMRSQHGKVHRQRRDEKVQSGPVNAAANRPKRLRRRAKERSRRA